MRRPRRGGRFFSRPVLPLGQHVLQAHRGVLPVRTGLPVRPKLEPHISTWCHTRPHRSPSSPHREPLPAPLISRRRTRRTSHWGQCGGTGFVGNRCCPSDASCIVRSLDFSQCVPAKLPADVVHTSGASFDPDLVSDATCTTGPWTQCGGKYYTGDSCCPKGYSCTYRTEGFSQCARSHSPDAK